MLVVRGNGDFGLLSIMSQKVFVRWLNFVGHVLND